MADQTPVTLNQFAFVSLTDAYWALDPASRRGRLEAWLAAVREGAEAMFLYQVFPMDTKSDLLVWSGVRSETPDVPARFFDAFARATSKFRTWIRVNDTRWGFTKPSQYTKVRSAQEMDPFTAERATYLTIYPFTKTSEWYQLTREVRRDLMGEHIKVGKQYEEIRQLLLYSTGLQDQEFVVVYEMNDLLRFSDLVTELRSTKSRPYTLSDAPLRAAVLRQGADALAPWL
jgi:chlorite dismutase